MNLPTANFGKRTNCCSRSVSGLTEKVSDWKWKSVGLEPRRNLICFGGYVGSEASIWPGSKMAMVIEWTRVGDSPNIS